MVKLIPNHLSYDIILVDTFSTYNEGYWKGRE